MSEQRIDKPKESAPDVRIERMNADKTRKVPGSDTEYHVYFELSESPPPEWRSIFAQSWKALQVTQEAGIEVAFLVVRCRLQDVSTVVQPLLIKVVTATNEAYRGYAQKEATALEHREDLWKEEREHVEATAASLHFT